MNHDIKPQENRAEFVDRRLGMQVHYCSRQALRSIRAPVGQLYIIPSDHVFFAYSADWSMNQAEDLHRLANKFIYCTAKQYKASGFTMSAPRLFLKVRWGTLWEGWDKHGTSQHRIIRMHPTLTSFLHPTFIAILGLGRSYQLYIAMVCTKNDWIIAMRNYSSKFL